MIPARNRLVLSLAIIALLCAAIVVYLRMLRVPPQPIEATRGSLVLLDGRLCLRGRTIPFTGIMVETGETGVLLSRSAVSNGLLEGLSEGYYTNGQRQVAELFHAGVSDGARTKWHSNGRMLSEAKIVAGKLHGTFRRWSEDGTLIEEIEMNQGNPHGLSRAFYPSGCLKAEARLEGGKMIEQKFYKDGECKPASAGV